jgi:hypothetical protein
LFCCILFLFCFYLFCYLCITFVALLLFICLLFICLLFICLLFYCCLFVCCFVTCITLLFYCCLFVCCFATCITLLFTVVYLFVVLLLVYNFVVLLLLMSDFVGALFLTFVPESKTIKSKNNGETINKQKPQQNKLSSTNNPNSNSKDNKPKEIRKKPPTIIDIKSTSIERTDFLKEKENRRLIKEKAAKAAKTIQRAFRKYLFRQRLALHMEEKQKKKAAVVLHNNKHPKTLY